MQASRILDEDEEIAEDVYRYRIFRNMRSKASGKLYKESLMEQAIPADISMQMCSTIIMEYYDRFKDSCRKPEVKPT